MASILHIIVSGRVQGVGFRYHTESVARRYKVSGWVRNLATGDVEILARIPEGRKTQFLEEIEKGPPGARVTRMNTLPAPDTMHCPEQGFTIRR